MLPQTMADLSNFGLVARGCVFALTVLFFGLSLAITVTRLRTRTLYGVPDDPARFLTKLVRAHGNTAEYVGVLALLILALGTAPRSEWVQGLMVLAVVARLVFAVAMLTCSSLAIFDPVRALAVTGTYVAGFGLGIALLIG